MKIKGDWFIRLYGPDGTLKQETKGHNVITTDGLSGLVGFLNSAVAAASTFTFRYIGIGAGTTGEAASDTALESELARHTGTVSQITGGIYRVIATFGSGLGTGAVTEYGLLNSSSAGTLFSRDTEAVINKGANDDLVVTTEVTFS